MGSIRIYPYMCIHGFLQFMCCCQASEAMMKANDGKGKAQHQKSKGAAHNAGKNNDSKGKGQVDKKDKKGKGKGNMCARM